MSEIVRKVFDEHLRVIESVASELVPTIAAAASLIAERISRGGRVLVFGNGGSAADAQHFAAELVGRFRRERAALAAIALTTDTSILTAVANDYGYDRVFERQVEAHAGPGDVAIGISTSGNSESVLRGLAAARARGAATLVLGGGTGGKMGSLADLALIVPSSVTARIQEAHITILHALCEMIDERVNSR